MQININNSNQIGGAVTKITSGNHSIIIDFGEALPGYEATPEWDAVKDNVKAVFFTHNHGDHFAKFSSIPKDIPLYMSYVMRETQLINLNARIDLKEKKGEDTLNERLAKSRLENNVVLFKENEEVKIGDFTITPYSVDHSVYDAYMFLIQADEENLLHTGDFRTHGYRGNKFFKLLRTIVMDKAKHIDYLITEGTNITRNVPIFSEFHLQKKVDTLFDEHKKVFLLTAGTNLDTMATYCNSAYRHGHFTACNSRVYKIIELFKETAGVYSKAYKLKRVGHLTSMKKRMHSEGFLGIINSKSYSLDLVKEYVNDDEKPIVVYAMWKGYIESGNLAYNEEMAGFLDSCKALGIEVLIDGYHTSGHASIGAIEKLINTVKPTKAIYPIHTDSKKAFENLNIPQDLKDRIVY